MNKEGDNTSDEASELDVRGLMCPEPVMMLHNRIREIGVGDTVRVIATDPSTQRDIPKFCHFLGHDLLAEDHTEQEYVYLIRKTEREDDS